MNRFRFDVKPYLDCGVFWRLRDTDLFRSVNVVAGSVEWPGGLDLSYETLYVRGETITGDGGTHRSEIEVRG